MGLVFIRIIPLGWGVDEQVHLSRAYQISEGTLRERKLAEHQYGGRLPVELKDLADIVHADLSDNNSSNAKQVDDARVYQNLQGRRLSGNQVVQDFTGSGIYFPVAYMAPAAGIVIARIFHPTIGGIVFGARFATLLLFIALVSASLYLLRKRNAKWFIFVVALLPMSLFQASIVNVDSYALGLSLFLLAQLIYLWSQEYKVTNRQLAFLSVTGGLLALSKPNYLFLSIAILLIPSRILTKTQHIYVRIGMALIIIIPAALWNFSIHGIVGVTGPSQRPGMHIGSSEQLRSILGHPFGYINVLFKNILNDGWFGQMVGVLGHNFIMVPDYVIYLETVLLTTATFFAREKLKIVTGIVLFTLGFIGLGSIVTTLYLVYTPVGSLQVDGIQGRYFLPILPFILYGMSLVLPIKITMPERFARLFFPTVSVLCLISAASYYAFRTG